MLKRQSEPLSGQQKKKRYKLNLSGEDYYVDYPQSSAEVAALGCNMEAFESEWLKVKHESKCDGGVQEVSLNQ